MSVSGEPLRLGVLLSGRGSNFLAIAESIRAGRLMGVEIAAVISNVADSGGLQAAREIGLPTAVFVSKGRKRLEHDADLIACLRAHRVDLVCLAGYMRILTPARSILSMSTWITGPSFCSEPFRWKRLTTRTRWPNASSWKSTSLTRKRLPS